VSNFTDKQGQYLAFINAYTLIHQRAPAESDMQRFFRVTPPSVHRMVVELESRGLITRTPGTARSIRVTVTPDDIPALREPESIRTPVGDH
jgi:DNA-binding MarR family transcriptional regulator